MGVETLQILASRWMTNELTGRRIQVRWWEFVDWSGSERQEEIDNGTA